MPLMTLSRKGLQRRIVASPAARTCCGHRSARSDMIAVVSHRPHVCSCRSPPWLSSIHLLTIPSVKFRLVWNRRRGEHCVHQWLRSLFTVVGDGGNVGVGHGSKLRPTRSATACRRLATNSQVSLSGPNL